MSGDPEFDWDGKSTDEIVSPAMIRASRSLKEGSAPQKALRGLEQAERWVVQEIAQMQQRAGGKFSDWSPDPQAFWWVTPTGCAQATTAAVAKLKATWFGDASVVDVCCGVGGDLMALAARGSVLGIDADPRILAYARLNLQAANLVAETRCLDVMSEPVHRWKNDAQCMHVDPDRRDQGQRRTASEYLTPPWSVINNWLPAFEGGVIKLAPATEFADDVNMNVHRSWISYENQVREQLVVFGSTLEHPWWTKTTATTNNRSAISQRAQQSGWSVFSGDVLPESSVDHAEQPQSWLIDPDRAIRAAGLTVAFAHHFHLRCIGGPTGYLTTDNAEVAKKTQPYATVVSVMDTLSTDDRKLRKHFRSRQLIPVRIKVRGGGQSPEKLQKQLKPNRGKSPDLTEADWTPVELWIGKNGRGAHAGHGASRFAAVCRLREEDANPDSVG